MKDHLQDPFSGNILECQGETYLFSQKSRKMAKKVSNCEHFSNVEYYTRSKFTSLFLFPILSNASTLIRHHIIFPTTAFSFSHFYHFEQCFRSRKYTKSSLFHLFNSKTKSIKMSVGTILLNFNMHLKTLFKWRFRLYMWGGAWDCGFLTSSQVIQMLLVFGTHFE